MTYLYDENFNVIETKCLAHFWIEIDEKGMNAWIYDPATDKWIDATKEISKRQEMKIELKYQHDLETAEELRLSEKTA